MNPKGEVIQQAQKSKKEFMSYHNTTFTLSDEKGIKVFDKTNNYQLSESFDDVVECDVFIKERLKVEKDRKYGVIDTNGKILLPIEYDACECLKDDFLVEKNGAKFILSSNGNQFDLSRYKNIKVHNPFANTFFIEEENGNRIYNTKTEKITDFDFEDYQPLNEIYYYAVSKNSKYGAIDYNSDLIIPMEYDEITETKGSHFLTINNTSKGHKFFFFDPKGNLLKTYEAKQYQVWMLLNVFSIILDDKFYINYKGEITDIDKSK
ncbi:MAG TPA: WG repeat-containing protein [Flavobacterium sp.]|nr:WG repeat-containing protein [Flavobacterium sp.]